MKNINYIALASLAAAITAVSCSKEEMQSSAVSEGTVLAASIAQAPDTKTAMSGATEGSTVSIVWSAGDKLSVLSGASFGTKNEFTLKSGDEGKTSGSFTGANISGDIIAVYPYSSDVAYSTDKVTLNIPQAQAYTDATFAQNSIPMVAKGTVGTPLTFNYLFSAIAFKIVGTGKSVTKITVAATTPLWGPAEISNLDSTPTIAMTGADSKYNTVELTFDSAESIDSDKVFYIAVPAGSYTFAVNVYCGSEVFHESYTTAKTFTIGNIKYNSTAKAFSDNGPAYVEGSYIGEGQKVNGIYWAPVNCGYDADHLCGKLYQWGRMDGSGYYKDATVTKPAQDASGKVIQTNVVDLEKGTYTTLNPDALSFYKNANTSTYDWYTSTTASQLSKWPITASEAPSGSSRIGNPCPNGWRVPTSDELGNLVYSNWDPSTQKGTTKRNTNWNATGWDSTNHTGNLNGLILPAAGYRSNSSGSAYSRGSAGDYWSSSVNGFQASYLGFGSASASMFSESRANGYSVRCVQE